MIRIGFGVAFFPELFLNFFGILREDLRFALFCQARSPAGSKLGYPVSERPPPALETFWTNQTGCALGDTHGASNHTVFGNSAK